MPPKKQNAAAPDAAPEPQTPAAPKYPSFAVAERRALMGSAAMVSQAIRLINQPEEMQLRWINSQQSTNRVQHAIRSEGYELVNWDELADKETIAAIESPDGKVVRGGKDAQEYLAKIPKRLYKEIIRRERVDRKARRKSATETQSLAAQSMAETAADRSLPQAERDHLNATADIAGRRRGMLVESEITEFRETVDE